MIKLTSLDFFRWENVKSKDYADNHTSMQTLEQTITDKILQLPLVMFEQIIENWTLRSRDQHLKKIMPDVKQHSQQQHLRKINIYYIDR